MDDTRIIGLYWDRNPDAIAETERKYGAYCLTIAGNILPRREDAQECVNDTWLRAWQSIPPQRPNHFSTFLGRITRNLAFNRFQALHAQKRGGGELPLVLEELEQCVSGPEDVARAYDRKELAQAIESFLRDLPERNQRIFICRYWYADPIADIARKQGMSVGNVTVTLSRLREKLRVYLTERGFDL